MQKTVISRNTGGKSEGYKLDHRRITRKNREDWASNNKIVKGALKLEDKLKEESTNCLRSLKNPSDFTVNNSINLEESIDSSHDTQMDELRPNIDSVRVQIAIDQLNRDTSRIEELDRKIYWNEIRKSKETIKTLNHQQEVQEIEYVHRHREKQKTIDRQRDRTEKKINKQTSESCIWNLRKLKELENNKLKEFNTQMIEQGNKAHELFTNLKKRNKISHMKHLHDKRQFLNSEIQNKKTKIEQEKAREIKERELEQYQRLKNYLEEVLHKHAQVMTSLATK